MLFSSIFLSLASSLVSASAVPGTLTERTVITGQLGGVHTGIGSWYDASNGRDNTNGCGWCEFPYSNDDPIVAVDLSLMTDNPYDNNWRDNVDAKKHYCGKKIFIKVGDVTKEAYIGDGFDPNWVEGVGHPKTSLDIMHGLFNELWTEKHGSGTWNKNDVLKNGEWEWWLAEDGFNEYYAYRNRPCQN